MKIERSSSDEIRKAIKDKGHAKTLGDAIGLPDDVDKERIRRLVLQYERKHPGYIQNAIDEAKAQHALLGDRAVKFGEVNKGAGGRLLFELPEPLHKKISDAYPLMFSDKKHFQWFCKNFKELLVPEVY